MTDPKGALERAITLAGGQTALAAICGCTQGAIWQMLNKAEPPQLSVQYVLKVEAALEIPRHELRPDFYPAPDLCGAGARRAEGIA